jgi:hypothetical protein
MDSIANDDAVKVFYPGLIFSPELQMTCIGRNHRTGHDAAVFSNGNAIIENHIGTNTAPSTNFDLLVNHGERLDLSSGMNAGFGVNVSRKRMGGGLLTGKV